MKRTKPNLAQQRAGLVLAQDMVRAGVEFFPVAVGSPEHRAQLVEQLDAFMTKLYAEQELEQ